MIPFCLKAQLILSGKVTDAVTGIPLAGARLALDNSFLSAVSDPKGNFIFHNLHPGDYSLKTSFLGYTPSTLAVSLQKNSEIALTLQPVSILEDELVIRSTRAGDKVPVTSQDLSRREIESLNVGQDMPMLLSNTVSAVATSDAGNGMGYTALRIRGTDMTRINVTVNGIPLNDPESHNVFWVDLPDFAASTDNIQIQRGVGTSTNGAAAFGASINLQSAKLNPDPYAQLSSSCGSFNTLKNSVSFGSGLINKHWTVDARVSKLNSDGYIDRAFSDLFSGYLSTAYSGRKSILRFNLFTGTEKTYQAWDGVPKDVLDTNRRYNGMGLYTDPAGRSRYYGNETDNYRQTHYQVLFSQQLSHALYLSTALHYTKGSGYYEEYRENDKLADYGIAEIHLPAPYYLLGNDTLVVPDSTIASSDLIRRKWLDNDFAGITWSLNWNTSHTQASVGGSWNSYTGRNFGRVIWTRFAGNSEIDHEWYSSKSHKKDFNLYAKVSRDLTEKLKSYADLQLRTIDYRIDGTDNDARDITQHHRFAFFNPKAGLFYSINSSNSLYLSVATANREPNRDNFVDANPSGPAPRKETLYDLESGYELRQGWADLHANLYFMAYRDQLVLTGAINDVGAAVMANVPESYRLGMELMAQIRISSQLQWNLTATLSRNKIISYTEFVDDWNTGGQQAFDHHNIDLAFSPSILAGSDLSLKLLKSGVIHLNTRFVGRQFIDNTQSSGRSLHPYLVNDIRFNYALHPAFIKELTLTLALNNFLNEKYESNAWVYRYYEGEQFHVLDGYFPQAGMNLMGGILVNL